VTGAADVCVVGGGIVGLAVAHALLAARPSLRLVVLEKEAAVAQHQTGHNSGVIHSGLYYRPGSLRAELCVRGAEAMRRFCDAHDVPHLEVGKVVVAESAAELPRLDELERRGRLNGVPGLRRLDASGLRAVEPEARGIAALHSPLTGIVDYGAVARALAGELTARGASLRTGEALVASRPDASGLRLFTSGGEVQCRYAVNCAGLWSDRVARLLGSRPSVRILPFRGEYRMLAPTAAGRVRGLIYPVPDPALPFLGVHVTRTIAGHVEAGPNAVWTLSRQGYRPGLPPLRDAWEGLGYPGLWRLGRRHARHAWFEYRRSKSPRLFAASVRRLVPFVADAELLPGPSGVRAQAVTAAGELVDDFVLAASERSLSVLNAPSPAATASLAIGERVAAEVLRALGV
jgi:(S)-2-hydroxyglutarate dehydrogenase